MKQLIHNGVLTPRYEAKGFQIAFKGREIRLTPEQEEMAVAWVKKLGTEYVEDKVFTKNFFEDFRQCLGIKEKACSQDFDFSEIKEYVESEKSRKQTMTKQEKKLQAATRKAKREADKEKYGYAIVEGKRVEIANYTAEPSCIFMGRGRHPLRGRWKRGPKTRDIVLNLSPDAPMPEGGWMGRVWQPESMWIARWKDGLREKTKHVWLSDSFHVKQEREIEKFDQAKKLEEQIEKVRAHIEENLGSPDPLRRKIATVCYLVDALKLRVGDEKDKDEADTVGATTLRPGHVSFGDEGLTVFDFLGKDSVHWHLEAKLPEPAVQNIRESSAEAESSIFKGVRSDNVSGFLDEAMPGLTAKVFRTYHATRIVDESLNKTSLSGDAPEFLKKYVATMANLEAAKACNHKKKVPKNWKNSLTRMEERLRKLREKKREIKAKKTGKKETKAQRLERVEERMREIETRIETKKATKEYNLNTSLKSYIDPRAYYEWGKRVEYDWKRYYSKTLQRKFQWVEASQPQKSG